MRDHNLTYDWNDEEDYATHLEIYVGDSDQVAANVHRDVLWNGDGLEFTELFCVSPQLLGLVQDFVAWADSLPPRSRPRLDPLVARAKNTLPNFS